MLFEFKEFVYRLIYINQAQHDLLEVFFFYLLTKIGNIRQLLMGVWNLAIINRRPRISILISSWILFI